MVAILEAKNLEKSFGSVTAARDINLAVADNEVLGIIGANGAGKTTFVNMVTGYVKPSSGQILFRGRDITLLDPRAITNIGISRSFQVPQVFTTATVHENLLIALGVASKASLPFWRPLRRPEMLEAATELLARYRIEEYGEAEAATLPQGVRKLLDIAMAMVRQPEILLLDEPTSGVSVEEKFGIMDIVMGVLKEQGVTVLFVEHDMEIINRYAGRVIAFYEGAIIANGPPDAVLADEKVREYVIGQTRRKASAKPKPKSKSKPAGKGKARSKGKGKGGANA